MAGKRPPRLIRLRYRDHRGDVNVTPAHLGKLNGTDVRGAMALVDLWLAEGALRREPDGTLVVVRYREPGVDLARALARQATTTEVDHVLADRRAAEHAPHSATAAAALRRLDAGG